MHATTRPQDHTTGRVAFAPQGVRGASGRRTYMGTRIQEFNNRLRGDPLHMSAAICRYHYIGVPLCRGLAIYDRTGHDREVTGDRGGQRIDMTGQDRQDRTEDRGQDRTGKRTGQATGRGAGQIRSVYRTGQDRGQDGGQDRGHDRTQTGQRTRKDHGKSYKL